MSRVGKLGREMATSREDESAEEEEDAREEKGTDNHDYGE
jgi:hypothetical protein